MLNVTLIVVFLVFGRAIHSLSKIGEELYMEPLEHGVSLYQMQCIFIC